MTSAVAEPPATPARTVRPAPPPVNFEAIPTDLRNLPQWVLWSYDFRDDKWTKIPRDAYPPFKEARANDARTWRTFSAAQMNYKLQRQKIGFAGVGFVFAKGGGFFGVDFDKVRDAVTGAVEPWAQEEIALFNTYTEISPSGTGFKLIGCGEPPITDPKKTGGKETAKAKRRECYRYGRFFTMTGDVYEGRSAIRDCSDVIDPWFRKHFSHLCQEKKQKVNPAPSDGRTNGRVNGHTNGHFVPGAGNLSDSEILEVAFRAKDGEKVKALWDGNASGYNSPSEADLALCNKLAFYCGPDPARIDSMFRQSKLYREKWDRDDYREETIGKALNGRTEFYTGSKPESGTSASGQSWHYIRNCATDWDEEGKPKTVPIPMDAILQSVKKGTDDWPRRVGSALFVHADEAVSWMDGPSALFGFFGTATRVPPEFHGAKGFHTKEEVYHELRRTATSYRAVEILPHEPPIEQHYYACDAPPSGDGSALAGFVDRFRFESDIDADLFRACLATLFWGGAGGTRPAFMFDSTDGRGAGKSTAASMVVHLAGGSIDLSANEDITVIKQRLLSPEGLTKRIALLDNVKSMRFSWAELEALITIPTISGKAMYIGEAGRPNNLTWLLTLNGASLSTDMAQRCVIIRIKRPKYDASWTETTKAYIGEHRAAIIGDLLALLRSERVPLDHYSRWAAWEKDILSRMPEPSDAQKVIAERQGVADVEEEETGILEDFFADQLRKLKYLPDKSRIFIPSAISTRWWNWATNERETSVSVTRKLKQKIDQKKLRRIVVCPNHNHGRGFVWIGKDVPDGSSETYYDLEERFQSRSDQDRKDG